MDVFGILVLIAAAGSVVGNYMRKRQELVLMSKMPADEARAYYEGVLRKERRLRWILVAILVAAVAGMAALMTRGA